MKKQLLVYVNSMNALGGIERVIANLTRALANYYDITILVKDEPISAYTLDSRIKMDTINAKLTMNMDSRMQRVFSVPVNILKSKKKLKEWLRAHNNFDYVYTAFPTNGVEMYFADKKMRNKIVASEHASYYAYNSVYKKMKEWLYPRLRAISVPTTMDTEIYQKLGYKVTYIPHLTTYTKTVDNDLKSRRIINVGRLTSDKQQLMLLDIWKKVNDKVTGHEYKLQIIGCGEEENNLKKKIIDLNLNNVELIPHTSNIADYYKNAELFTFTSKMEGFGMVLLEAMSYGVPCISFDCPSGPRDMVIDNENGYLIECYDVDAYANRICEYICMSDDEKRALSNKALKTIEHWNNDEIIQKWIYLFEDQIK